MIAKSHRWQRTAVAAAAIALLSLTGTEALALSLGRIAVQSALGEPLRAEIDVPDINVDEAASLRTTVAPPEAFATAGLEYNPAMSGLQAVLTRRSDGSAFIRITSQRAINEPFVDMIIEATWASGRIVRDYTMLFDPPSLKQAAPSPTLAQTNASPATTPSQSSGTSPAATSKSGATSTDAVRPPPQPKATSAASAAKGSPKADTSVGGQKLTVKPGDSASKIANTVKPSDVSLDQMLVALIRSNPDAFMNGNLNRLRAGAVMDLPSADQAKSVGTSEATQIVIAQSKDFNEFRRNLAVNAPKAKVEGADRQATGKLDAKVEDKKPGSATSDKLTLSKGAVKSAGDEAKIAKERAEKDAAARAAELAKNISDLSKLSAATTGKAAVAPASPASQAPSGPSVAMATTSVAATPQEPAKAASSPMGTVSAAPPVAAATSAAASAPAKPKPKPAVAPAVPVEPPGLIDELLADPTLPLAGGGLLVLLGGVFFYRRYQRKKKAAHVDSSFLESRLQPDSFFGASGGQRVDTANDGAASASSMVYSASQLDGADDVDPVAEADVYLAYGRDVQAEEILREAVKRTPTRAAIHMKLLEIFSKRRDTNNFQASAAQVLKLTGPDSPDWARACEMGLSIDPDNALYQPGGATASTLGALTADADRLGSATNSTIAMPTASASELAPVGMDLDLDLDFSADEDAPVQSEDTVKLQSQPSGVSPHDGIDFDVSSNAELTPSMAFPEVSSEQDLSAAPQMTAMAELQEPSDSAQSPMSMDDLNLLDPADTPQMAVPEFLPTGTMDLKPAPNPEPSNPTEGMLEFDLTSLSLDLDGPAESAGASLTGEDPLETKLALAEEFVSIGDHDGARALIEEVVSEATGELRTKAERALANLG